MTEKGLHKLNRYELLQLLLDQSREAAWLQAQLEERDAALTESKALVDRLKAKLDEKDKLIEKLKGRLDEKDARISTLKKRWKKKPEGLSQTAWVLLRRRPLS